MFDVAWRPAVNHYCPSIISLMVIQPRRANYPVQTRTGDITTRASLRCCSDFSVTSCAVSCSWTGSCASCQKTCLDVSGCGWTAGTVSGGTCYGRPTVNSKSCCDGQCQDQTSKTAASIYDYSALIVSGLDFHFK
jgi:hypothetical protein